MKKQDLEKFVGLNVVFGVSDPWDFSTIYGDREFSASVLAVLQSNLLLELAEPLRYKGVEFKYVTASARHEDKCLSEISTSHAVPVNFTPAIIQEKEDVDANELFKAATAWRGWGLIGGLKLQPK